MNNAVFCRTRSLQEYFAALSWGLALKGTALLRDHDCTGRKRMPYFVGELKHCSCGAALLRLEEASTVR